MESAELEKWFAEFWLAYPRRVGKLAAKKAYVKALQHASPELINEGAKQYACERRGAEQQFTKHPSTWLSAGCWDDEEGANSNAKAGGSGLATALGRLRETEERLRDEGRVSPSGAPIARLVSNR